MDGSHASHCEKIIAKCRQLRQRGGQPKPRDNKEPGSLSEWAPSCPRSPNLHIYMQRSRVNCIEFLRWVQSGGCCCFILHNKHTVSTHALCVSKNPKAKRLNQRSFRFMNKSWIIGIFVSSFRNDRNRRNFIIVKKNPQNRGGRGRSIHNDIGFISSMLSWELSSYNLHFCPPPPGKTWKFHTFLWLPCVFGKLFVFDCASQEMSMCAFSAAGELRGPFNTPDLILTVVDGQKPKCVRVATVPDLW